MSNINLTNNTSPNENHIHVKLQYNDEFRRFFIPNNVSSLKYTDLDAKIKSLLHITGEKEEEIVLKYKDEEDEWITISSDVELETGLLIAGNGIFRLLCELKKQPSSNKVNNDTSSPQQTTTFEERGQPHWKKYQDGGGYKGKGNRKWKKNYEGGKPRGGRRFHYSEQNYENNSEVTETPTSTTDENNVVNNENNGGGGRWRERKQQKKEFKRERKREQKSRRKRFDDEKKDDSSSSSSSSGSSNSDVALLTLDEIKKELVKLKDEESILKEKVKGAKENLKAVKDLIKEKRKDEKVQPDEILSLREDLQGKKKVKNGIQAQLRNTRSRMRTLREAAETKQV
jgi:uncharacterized spore protein YtfJ